MPRRKKATALEVEGPSEIVGFSMNPIWDEMVAEYGDPLCRPVLSIDARQAAREAGEKAAEPQALVEMRKSMERTATETIEAQG